ncbi:hypothetical protein VD0004_g8360 [Verticillium dahliae]|uniref:cellulase n=1 Tax=Verticillium dahliae TaxID=27337 RepID=A0A444RMF1_VERDA|nr:hypothetical protein VD0004_g8360 [Verticillium dahliae]PNH65915.1 hypothetical protein VD0001_g8349 [Verticillium dahliae]RXG42292.1 hypothetical protein VDGE_01692 [Verticillium dahliae]
MKFLLPVVLAGGAIAQSGPWGQCGGSGYSGPTTCVAGYTCTFSNQWYSQCLPGAAPPPAATTTRAATTTAVAPPPAVTTTTRATTTTAAPPTTPTNPGSAVFKWYGTNEAGAEFGESVLPGQWGKHYIFPDTSTISTLLGQGYNTFRVQYKMERLAPNGITGALDAAYLRNLTEVVNFITGRGGYAVIDPHNYGRFNGAVITSTSAFKTYHQNVASQFASNSRVVWDTNNEYHSMDQALVVSLNQAAIDGIRAAGATQTIFVEGNQWSGAWSWVDVNDSMKNLVDPLNKIVYQMHQYLDSDSSGTSPNCVSSTIGVERVRSATNWLRQNGKVGIIGEFAGGANTQCRDAVRGLLTFLEANADVWQGYLWWAAGPWWDTYMYSFEPPSGTGYQYYNALLKEFIP